MGGAVWLVSPHFGGGSWGSFPFLEDFFLEPSSDAFLEPSSFLPILMPALVFTRIHLGAERETALEKKEAAALDGIAAAPGARVFFLAKAKDSAGPGF